MDVGKNIWEITEEKRLKLLVHVNRMPENRLPRRILQWEPEGKRREDPKKTRRLDAASTTNQPGTNRRDIRGRDMWRN